MEQNHRNHHSDVAENKAMEGRDRERPSQYSGLEQPVSPGIKSGRSVLCSLFCHILDVLITARCDSNGHALRQHTIPLASKHLTGPCEIHNSRYPLDYVK